MKAVIAQSLSKQYEQGKKAVASVSLTLNQGEVFGFLGPNGAGKTTMVKLLGGMLTPTGGSCRVFDIDPAERPEQVHKIAGVVTEHAQMYDHLTGVQNLIFYGSVFGMNESESRSRAQSLLGALDLADAKDRRLATYSTGMRQRLSLARAMIHRPRILFLDEPTSGLDPESAQSVNLMVKRLARDEGATIFLCTHQLRYAQEICSTYGLIDDGMLLASGDLEALRGMVARGMTAHIRASLMPEDISHTQTAEGVYALQVSSESDIPPIIRRIVEAGGDVYHVSADSLSLEDIYFALIEKRKEMEETL